MSIGYAIAAPGASCLDEFRTGYRGILLGTGHILLRPADGGDERVDHDTKVLAVTPLPTNWTDGYGTVHAGPPPNGYWIASDDRWYAPELHPEYVAAPVEPVAIVAPDGGSPSGTGEPAPSIGAFDADDQPHTDLDSFLDADPAPSIGAFDAVDHLNTSDHADASFGAFDASPSLDDSGPFESSEPIEPAIPLERFDPARAAELAAGASPTASPGQQPTAPPSPWQMPSLDGAPSAPPPEQTAAPDPLPPRDGDAPTTNSRIVLTAVVGVLAILGLAAAGYLLMNQGDDTSSIISGDEASGSSRTPTLPAEITAPVDPTTIPAADAEMPSAEADATEAPPTTQSSAGGPGAVQPAASNEGGLEGIESCSRIDSDTLEITMVNVTDATASYLLTVVYLDDAGERIGDDNVYVSSLRPGERTVERSYVFSDAGVGCEVIDADRYDRNGVEGLADISACTIREPNSYGFIEADVTATNNGPSDVDYTVEVALIGSDNIRRGYGTAYIERTPVGASAPGEVYTTVEYDETLRCEVVAVTRFESTQ